MTYIYNLPTNFDPAKDDAGSIHVWLERQGCTVESVSILNAPDEASQVIIECDHDPYDHLASFPATITERDELTDALNQIDIENASMDELKVAVHLLKELLVKQVPNQP